MLRTKMPNDIRQYKTKFGGLTIKAVAYCQLSSCIRYYRLTFFTIFKTFQQKHFALLFYLSTFWLAALYLRK